MLINYHVWIFLCTRRNVNNQLGMGKKVVFYELNTQVYRLEIVGSEINIFIFLLPLLGLEASLWLPKSISFIRLGVQAGDVYPNKWYKLVQESEMKTHIMGLLMHVSNSSWIFIFILASTDANETDRKKILRKKRELLFIRWW